MKFKYIMWFFVTTQLKMRLLMSHFQVDTLEKEPREPGYDLEVHWHQKWVKYGEAWGVEGITFMPIVVSSPGSWEEGVIQAIKPSHITHNS